jgi:hypothetical protein
MGFIPLAALAFVTVVTCSSAFTVERVDALSPGPTLTAIPAAMHYAPLTGTIARKASKVASSAVLRQHLSRQSSSGYISSLAEVASYSEYVAPITIVGQNVGGPRFKTLTKDCSPTTQFTVVFDTGSSDTGWQPKASIVRTSPASP